MGKGRLAKPLTTAIKAAKGVLPDLVEVTIGGVTKAVDAARAVDFEKLRSLNKYPESELAKMLDDPNYAPRKTIRGDGNGQQLLGEDTNTVTNYPEAVEEARLRSNENPTPPSELRTNEQTFSPEYQQKRADLEGTGDKMRTQAGITLGGEGAGSGYEISGVPEYQRGFLEKILGKGAGAITNKHHAGFLEKLKRAVVGHKSWETLEEGMVSPIVTGLAARGIKLGNWYENIADALSVMTDASRQAKKRSIVQQSNGLFHQDTANELLGGYGPTSSGVSFGEVKAPKNPTKEITASGAVRNVDPELERAGDTLIENIRSNQPRKGYKVITIKHPKTGEILEKWKPKTADEFNKRFEIVSGKLSEYLGEPVPVPSVKKAKISKKLDIYGGDHDIVHELTDALETKPGNPIYDMKVASDKDLLRDMPVEQVIEMQYQQLVTMETVLGNVLQQRYELIKKIFKRKHPNGYKGFGETFEELSTEQKRIFFIKNVNEIAAAGGLKQIISETNALKPITNWDQGLTEVFGWKPQTFGQPNKLDIESIAKETAETVPVSQPLPTGL